MVPTVGGTPPGGGSNRTLVVVGVVIAVLLLAVLGVGIALLTKKDSGTTTAASTTTTAAPTTSASTTTSTTTTTEPSTTAPPTTAAVPACSNDLMFQAAVAKEGFDPKDPSYDELSKYGDGPGATGASCIGPWAIATVSRPNVGSTDGDTLFHAEGGTWVEISELGFPVTHCVLEDKGVPADVAAKLVEHVGGDTSC